MAEMEVDESKEEKEDANKIWITLEAAGLIAYDYDSLIVM